MNWQDLEKAPKDGTCIILWFDGLDFEKELPMRFAYWNEGLGAWHSWFKNDHKIFENHDPLAWAALTKPTNDELANVRNK